MIYGIIFLIWNIFVMLVYVTDKLLAKRQRRRISEKDLLLFACLFGGVGAMFGMVIFNHKTSKPKFRFLVPLAAVFSTLAVWAFFKYLI